MSSFTNTPPNPVQNLNTPIQPFQPRNGGFENKDRTEFMVRVIRATPFLTPDQMQQIQAILPVSQYQNNRGNNRQMNTGNRGGTGNMVGGGNYRGGYNGGGNYRGGMSNNSYRPRPSISQNHRQEDTQQRGSDNSNNNNFSNSNSNNTNNENPDTPNNDNQEENIVPSISAPAPVPSSKLKIKKIEPIAGSEDNNEPSVSSSSSANANTDSDTPSVKPKKAVLLKPKVSK